MMEKRNTPADELCRDWKDTLADVLLAASLVIIGAAVGIGLCKFCPEFWYFVNWGLGQ